MNIKQDNIVKYINYDTGIPIDTTLKSFLIMSCMVGIPSSLFGAYSNITRMIILPLVMFFCLWDIYLMINKKIKKEHFILFLGVISVFISSLFMIATYKFALMFYKVSMFQMFFVIILYVISNLLNGLNVLRLIKKGYYSKKGKNESPMALFFAVSILSLSMGKMLSSANIEFEAAALVSLLLFLSFLFSTGSHNFLKYFFMIKLLRRSI